MKKTTSKNKENYAQKLASKNIYVFTVDFEKASRSEREKYLAQKRFIHGVDCGTYWEDGNYSKVMVAGFWLEERDLENNRKVYGVSRFEGDKAGVLFNSAEHDFSKEVWEAAKE